MRRRFRRDPTHALLADQSHSIPDNLMALLRRSGAWNCSTGNCGCTERISSHSSEETMLWSVACLLWTGLLTTAQVPSGMWLELKRPSFRVMKPKQSRRWCAGGDYAMTSNSTSSSLQSEAENVAAFGRATACFAGCSSSPQATSFCAQSITAATKGFVGAFSAASRRGPQCAKKNRRMRAPPRPLAAIRRLKDKGTSWHSDL